MNLIDLLDESIIAKAKEIEDRLDEIERKNHNPVITIQLPDDPKEREQFIAYFNAGMMVGL